MSFCERPYDRFLGVFWKAARIGTWTERLVVVSMGVVEGGCASFMDPVGGLPLRVTAQPYLSSPTCVSLSDVLNASFLSVMVVL